MDIEKNLAQIGLKLPDAPSPAANYVPVLRSGSLLFVAGQISRAGDVNITGRLGEDLDIPAGQDAARVCALNILAHVRSAVGGEWPRVAGCVRLGGFVNATPDFTAHSMVLNGASDLMVAAMGDSGRHVRAAVGVSSLPFGVAVEVDAIFELKP